MESSDPNSLAVLIAARNEADVIADTIASLRASFPGAALWVADDGSDDGTAEAAMAAGAKVVRRGRPHGKGGNMTADVHLVLDSAKTATDGAAQAQQQLDQVKKSGQIPKQFAPALDSVTIKAAGSELVMGAKIAEADVASMIGMLAAFAH